MVALAGVNCHPLTGDEDQTIHGTSETVPPGLRAHAGIEHVSQGIPQEIKGQHSDEDGQAWNIH